MKAKIYDYANKTIEIELQDKPIEEIYVRIESGDEIVTIYYDDSTRDEFDSSDCRFVGFYDGSYTVEGENLEKWLNYQPEGDDVIYSYQRQEMFEGEL